MFIEDIFAQLVRECSIFPRMAGTAVRAGHHPVLAHEILDVGLLHIEGGNVRAAFLNDGQRCFNRRGTAFLRDIGQSLADKLFVRRRSHKQRLGAAATVEILLHLRHQAWPHR